MPKSPKRSLEDMTDEEVIELVAVSSDLDGEVDSYDVQDFVRSSADYSEIRDTFARLIQSRRLGGCSGCGCWAKVKSKIMRTEKCPKPNARSKT